MKKGPATCRPFPFAWRGMALFFFLLVLLVVLVVALLGPAHDGAQDVAEARAGIGGAVLGHRLLLLLDLARLDRERDLARRAVDGRDLRVHLLADGEAVRTLLGAVARELGLADEAR